MVDAAVIFGANKTAAELELYDALLFEMALAKVIIFRHFHSPNITIILNFRLR